LKSRLSLLFASSYSTSLTNHQNVVEISRDQHTRLLGDTTIVSANSPRRMDRRNNVPSTQYQYRSSLTGAFPSSDLAYYALQVATLRLFQNQASGLSHQLETRITFAVFQILVSLGQG
jgi:hypothetical protein